MSAAPSCRVCGQTLTGEPAAALCAGCLGLDLFADAPEPPPCARIGDYELAEELGRGGMGVVHRARHVPLNRPAAVKLILTGPLASAVERQRFLGEIEAAAALNHPGIVPVLDAGEEDGQLYFAMPLVDGTSLAERLAGGKVWEPRQAATFIREAALAMQHAHERGILHRDLKPANILVEGGAPRIADFGLARRMNDPARLTLTGGVAGTPAYLAPEQLEPGAAPTISADVYSLGAILHEMLAGRPAFASTALPELFAAVKDAEPPAALPGSGRAARDMNVIVRTCLAKEPSRRYASALALAEELDRWLRGDAITARPAGAAEKCWRWCRRNPLAAAGAAVAMVSMVVGVSAVWWQSSVAREALRTAEESLWRAHLGEARARRVSRERGQHLVARDLLARAAAHRPDAVLRNELIAALALPDLGEPEWTDEMAPGTRLLAADPDTGRCIFMTDAAIGLRAGGSETMLTDFTTTRAVVATPGLRRVALLGPSDDARARRCVVWELDGLKRLADVDGVTAACFFPDGERLALFLRGQSVVVLGPDGGEIDRQPFPVHADHAALSPDGDRVAVHARGTAEVEVWSLAAPPERRERLPGLPAGDLGAGPFTWHADGMLHLACGTVSVRVDPASGRVETVSEHQRDGVDFLVHPTGSFIAATSWDGVLRFCAPGVRGDLLRTTGLRPRGFSADGKRLAVSAGARLGVCEVAPPAVWRSAALPDRPLAVSFSPAGDLLAVVHAGGIAFMRPDTLRSVQALRLDRPTAGDWMPDGRFVVAERSAGVSVLRPLSEPPERHNVMAAKSEGAAFAACRVAPDGRRLAAVVSGRLVVWDMPERRAVAMVSGEPMLSHLAWSPDGRLVAAGYWNNSFSGGSRALVCSADGGAVLQRLESGSCQPLFTPDGSRLIVGSTHGYEVWSTADWRRLASHPREATGLDTGLAAVSAQADLLVLQASETMLRLLRLSTGEELARLEPPSLQKLSHLALSPDGRWLACAAHTSLFVWDLAALRADLRQCGLDWQDATH